MKIVKRQKGLGKCVRFPKSNQVEYLTPLFFGFYIAHRFYTCSTTGATLGEVPKNEW